jgi:hypothetical protein
MRPFGGNRFGECMFDALLAYDCAANPNRRLRPSTSMHAYWDCLWQARTCDEVTRCVLPSGNELCAGSSAFTACGELEGNGATRVECTPLGGPVKAASSCLATGQTCVRPDGNRSRCSVGPPDAGCPPPACAGTELHTCVDGTTDGVDCAYFGEGSCVTGAGGPTCKPALSPASVPCTPTSALTCDAGVVWGCPTGYPEHVDCNVLTGGGCDPNLPGRPDDLSRACWGPASSGADAGRTDGGPDANADAATSDASPCEDCLNQNTVVHSCAHGSEYTVDCASLGLGLGGCTRYTTVQDDLRAQCVPP